MNSVKKGFYKLLIFSWENSLYTISNLTPYIKKEDLSNHIKYVRPHLIFMKSPSGEVYELLPVLVA